MEWRKGAEAIAATKSDGRSGNKALVASLGIVLVVILAAAPGIGVSGVTE